MSCSACTLDRISDRKTEGKALDNRGRLQTKKALPVSRLVLFLVMLVLQNTLVQTLKSSCMQNVARRGTFRGAFFTSPVSFKLDARRQFTSSPLSASSTSADDDEKKTAKKKTSMLSRASKVLAAKEKPIKEPESEECSFIIDSNPDMKMTKKVQDDLIADYARTVSRIPTSVKAKKEKVEKVKNIVDTPELSKKFTPKYTPPTAPAAAAAPASKSSQQSNSNSMYTNTEYKEQSSSNKPSLDDFEEGSSEGDEGSDSDEGSFEGSQLTTSVTNMAFNSLDVSENTKRALSEVMNYKYVLHHYSSLLLHYFR